MLKTIVECDQCKKAIDKKHIRIRSAEVRFNKKRFYPIVLQGRNEDIHFCGIKCLSAFFKDKLLKAKK